jgi:hypothetical protein
VPVSEVDIDAEDWGDVEQVLEALRWVRVTSTSCRDIQTTFDYLDSLKGQAPHVKIAGEGIVSVLLSSYDEETGRYPHWVSFELTPAGALALADELRLAAGDALE